MFILVDRLIDALERSGEDASDYKEINRSKNILTNNDMHAIKNVKRHIFFDFHNFEDKIISDKLAKKAVDDIFDFLDNHKAFSK